MASTRKSLFTKPAWAAKSRASDTEVASESKTSIFSQAHIFDDIVTEERKRREREAERSKAREERQRTKVSSQTGNKEQADQTLAHDGESVKVGAAKRRKLSLQAEDEASDVGSPSESGREEGSPSSTRLDNTDSPRRKTRLAVTQESLSKHRETGTGGSGKLQSVSLLSDDDDNGDISEHDNSKDRYTSSHNENSRHIPTRCEQLVEAPVSDKEEEEDEEDEWLRDLKLKARREAQLKKQGQASENVNSVTSISLDPSAESGIERATSTPAPDDPLVHILINTIIPNAKSLVVYRRASQPLDKVKEYWCKHNELQPAIASKVFFTWNNTRLFDSTTMRGLIERLKTRYPTADGSDPSKGKIEIEAVTDEIHEYRLQQQERRRREAMGIQNPSISSQPSFTAAGALEAQAEATTETESEERPGPVIRLACPGTEDVNIRVRPHTSVAKIINAYRKMRTVEDTKQCWLVFDGDRLADHQTAESIGFEDEDTIDVHVR